MNELKTKIQKSTPLTYDRLAIDSGTNRVSLHHLINGKVPKPLQTLFLLARNLGKNMEELFLDISHANREKLIAKDPDGPFAKTIQELFAA